LSAIFGYTRDMIRLADYRRVIGLGQVLYLVGRRLKRQGVRYTMLAAVIGGGAILTDIAGNQIFGYDLKVSKLDAAMLPAVVALLTFGLGHGLISLSNLFSSERILIADANGLNLMEDRKKLDMRDHLQVLWDRVFRYEARLRRADGASGNPTGPLADGTDDPDDDPAKACDRDRIRRMVEAMPPACRKRLAIRDDDIDAFVEYIEAFRPLGHRLQATPEGFSASAEYALAQPLPQKVERSWIGFDLSLLEDWYDGAYFTANDTKLQEQFAAHQVIRSARELVGIPWRQKLAELLFGHPTPLWHVLTMKKIGTRVGTLIGRMNRTYGSNGDADFFTAQDFLWKHPAQDALVERVFGAEALAELQGTRTALFREIFSSCRRTAHEHLFRMFGRDWRQALTLRLAFDVEFAAGLLEETPDDDVTAMETLFGSGVYPRPCLDRLRSWATQALSVGDEFLADYVPEALDCPLTHRTARIAWAVNIAGVRRRALAHPHRAAEIFRATILPCVRQYTQQLCLVRQHYELTRLQLITYAQMVDELGDYDQSGD